MSYCKIEYSVHSICVTPKYIFSAVATVPRVAFAMRSSTNVAKTDDRFCPQYMTKYSAGSDEKILALFRGNDAQHVKVAEGEIQNLKITGQQIINSKLEKDMKGKPNKVVYIIIISKGLLMHMFMYTYVIIYYRSATDTKNCFN